MTQKEEAKRLVDDFLNILPSTDDIGFGQTEIAKRCAIKHCDEIINLAYHYSPCCMSMQFIFYTGVKREIKRLTP